MRFKTTPYPFKSILFCSFLMLCASILWCIHINANVTLPSIISNNMVLQQGVKVRIWGKASPGELVTVTISGQGTSAKANENGNWSVWLQPMKSDSTIEMVVTGKNTLIVKDILIGEVWVGAGQSNMEWNVSQSDNAEFEIANSKNSKIRIFRVKNTLANQPVEDLVGEWKICSPEIVGNVSGCLYFFGRELFTVIKQPLGLIEASWGGTPGESWMSKSSIEEVPELKYVFDNWNKIIAEYPGALQKYNQELTVWRKDSALNNISNKKPPRLPQGPGSKNEPAAIYNGMVAPLSPFTIKGVIWYQGEANAYEKTAYPYRFLLKALINNWRNVWGQGDFPFLIAQLSILNKHPYWPVLRESQVEATKLPNTALIVTIDIGDSTNAHFKNKQEVGRRFSLAARYVAYGEKVEYSGPTFKKAAIEGDYVRIYFDHCKGLQSKGSGTLYGFSMAGTDGQYKAAEARIEGNTVLISNTTILKPVSVSYAFSEVPVCNLINGVELPAVPFRTTVQ